MINDVSKGIVSNIQRFSLDDGPGIRTTIFLKGCNLACKWCHNPECIQSGKSLQFNAVQCVFCGACVSACPHHCHVLKDGRHHLDRTACARCMACAAHCPARALAVNGRELSDDEVLCAILRDHTFYKSSGGGVTFSGGEPLLQPDFLVALLKKCKQNGLHTAVDTAGNVSWNIFEEIMPLVDLFLFDVKAATPQVHKNATRRPTIKTSCRTCGS